MRRSRRGRISASHGAAAVLLCDDPAIVRQTLLIVDDHGKRELSGAALAALV
jgi:hypothetical protein